MQTLVAGIKTFAAATFYKLGFVYDPNEDTAHRIRIYLDGAEYTTTYGTATQVAAATFPSAVYMSPTFCADNGAATSAKLDCDWHGVAQLSR